jgi:hypothetical protein
MAFSKDFGWPFAEFLVAIPGAIVALIQFLKINSKEQFSGTG